MVKTKGRIKGVSAGLFLAFALSMLICVYAPFELYLTNVSEFWMLPKMLAAPVAVDFAVIFILLSVCFIIADIINKKLYRFTLAAASAVLVGLYIQGNFLIKNLPDMDGVSIDWSALPGERLKSVLAFAVPFVVFTVILFIIKKPLFEKGVKILSACLSLLFVVTLTTLFVTTNTEKSYTLVSTVKNEFQMSEDKNFIIFILDALDSGYFKDALEDDGELVKELDGFTYYDDALAAYPYTTHAMPMIFSGKWFENDKTFSEYRVDALNTSPYFSSLKEKGYSIGLYDSCQLDMNQEVFTGRFENCFPCQMDLKTKYTYALVIKMAGIKYAPWDLKRFCYDKLSSYLTTIKVNESGEKYFTWSDLTFYKKIKSENPITLTDNKCAKLIHLNGAHVPYQYDKDVNKIDSKLGTYEQNVQACVTLTKKYIQRLKESGVYDNSVIIIMGDHGYAGNDLKDEYNLKKRMNPAILIKGVNEKHAMTYSSAPISYEDLANAFVKLSDGSKSDEIFSWKDSDERTRKLTLFAYSKENHLTEYETDGKANDPDAMNKTGKEYNVGK